VKIKIELEIDTREDLNEIQDLVDLVTEFKEKLVAMSESEYYND